MVVVTLFVHRRLLWAEQGGTPGGVAGLLLWLLLLWALAVLSKENALVLPWLIVLVEACFFRGASGRLPHARLP